MRIIAFYLPQFHEIPENNEMWGKGFTEWVNVKKAKPLFDGHRQPVEPLNDYYYDLTDVESIRWQINLAKKYGIYGFCFYHYWYNGHKLLEKPIELFLRDKSLDHPFCLCWANHDWTMSWVSKEDNVIFKQNYDDVKDWDNHFYYLLPFLKDPRYITNDGKPLLVIYEAARIPQLNKMLDRWQELAVKNGFPGISFAYESVNADTFSDFDDSRFDIDIEYQPQYARVLVYQKKKTSFISALQKINDRLFHLHIGGFFRRFSKDRLTVFDYDELWEKILSMGPVSKKSVPGAFVNIDTTPRRQERGIVSVGMTPEKLKKYLTRQILRAKNEYKTDMLFVYAWNEWAEGAFMEPDKQWGYKVLEAFQEAVLELEKEK